jgi:hypothetical protein
MLDSCEADTIQLDIIVTAAVAENGVIGHGNALPWRLKIDMTHFRALTIGQAGCARA